MSEQTKYTQVIDDKTGEIKYVPEAPPTPPPNPPQGGTKPDPYQSDPNDPLKRRTYRRAEEDIKRDVDDADVSSNSKLTEVLSSLITNSKKLRFDRRLEQGKLDGSRLPAFKTSGRLFKKRAIKYRKYRFTILVDTSGSMFGNKMETSISAITKICKTLDELNIPVSVIGMNLSIRYLKAFTEPFDQDMFAERLIKNAAGIYELDNYDEQIFNCGGTSEAVAYDETLKYMRDTRKPGEEDVLFILSDGEPNGEGDRTPVFMPGDTEERLVPYIGSRNSCRVLNNYLKGVKDVRVYGIGIMSQATQVPQAKQLDDIAKLPELINKLVQDILV